MPPKPEGKVHFRSLLLWDVPDTICAVAGERTCFSASFLWLLALLYSLYQHARSHARRGSKAGVLVAVRAGF